MEFAMKKRFLSAMALLVGAGWTWADTVPSGTTPAPAANGPAAAPAPASSAAPRSLQLPDAPAVPKAVPPGAKTAPATTAPATPATTPAAPATNGTACQPQTCGQAPAGPPKVDLRDCHIGPDHCYWASAEYLLWWTKQGQLPVSLVTTGTPPASIGAIGQPGTAVVIGNQNLNYGTLS